MDAMSTEGVALRFVRALVPDRTAALMEGIYEVVRTDRVARLGRREVELLAGEGVLSVGAGLCRSGPRARAWLTARQVPSREGVAAPGVLVNLEESPLARLAAGRGENGEPFLLPHHVEAGERVRRLVERALLSPRVTMSYDAARVAGRSAGQGGAADLGDSALDARRRLAEIAAILPAECRGVVFDVCGLLKGLQTVETERRWPRRSAKLVLRIGLDQLARHFGLSAVATGSGSGTRGWLEERLPLMG
jgi:hypothetical protein